MARLMVQFPGDEAVLVDGVAAGRTNRVIPLPAGQHMVRLDGPATEPTERHVTTEGSEDVVRVGFSPASEPLERFSPIYCIYNGFLLGQFLSLSFARSGRENYAERRSRMLEFLGEIEVAFDIPEAPPQLGGEEHADLLSAVLPQIAARSKSLADFVLLGGLLTHYGILADSDPQTANEMLQQFEWLRDKHNLPPIDPSRFVLRPGNLDMDDVLSPSLAFLAEVVDGLEVEPETAFVIMPFKQPYASYFGKFYRPSLEAGGYRAFRAWGGLASEDYCDLLLKLIVKSGFVWADISELNYNVLYEIGAAHAFGKLSMLVVRQDEAGTTPANIGHDAVVRYSPDSENWPADTVSLMAALIATLSFAADRGARLRVSPGEMQSALDHVGRQLVVLLTPPEAQAARDDGRHKLEIHDYVGAERAFDEAIQLGLDDVPTLLGRGWSRVALERHAEAEADFDGALTVARDEDASRSERAVAAYFRGIAREQQNNLEGARADYTLSIELGNADAEVFRRRAMVLVTLGRTREAREDADRARELSPDDEDMKALDEALGAAGT